MNKDALVKKISKDSRLKKKKTLKVFNKVFDLISKEIKKGREVSIDDFGDFIIKRQDLKIIQQKNKSGIIIPPKDIIDFKISVLLNSYLNSNE
jgi:nucleoid DNA-binding protein